MNKDILHPKTIEELLKYPENAETGPYLDLELFKDVCRRIKKLEKKIERR